MTTLQSMFLEHTRPERFVPLLGQPVNLVRSQLAAIVGDAGLVVLSTLTPVEGLPKRTSMQIHTYVAPPDTTRGISLALDTADLLTDGTAPAELVEMIAACWEAVKSELPARVGALQARKSSHPLKKAVAAAAPALKGMLKEAITFDGGALNQYASIQGDVVFRWDLSVVFTRP